MSGARSGGGGGAGRASVLPMVAAAVAAAAVLAAAPHAVQWADADKPDPPTDLAATDVSPTGIDLSWSAPADDGGEEITGYKIERKEAGKGYATIEADTDSASTTYKDREGIKTRTTYVYKVSAINDDGTSKTSSEATARTTESSKGYKQVAPGEPRSLTADDISDSEVRLKWREPSDNGSPPVTGYKVEYKEAGEDDDEYETAESNTRSSGTEYTVDDLEEDTDYVFRVSAINSVGTGEPSGEASATPSDESRPDEGGSDARQAKPGKPRSVSAVPASDTRLYVKWTAPAGGGDPSAYRIEYKQKSGEWEMAAEVGGESTSFIHDVPNPNTSYLYRVTARNEAGLGQASAASASVKPEHTNAPSQVTITPLSPTSARLDWLPPSATFGQSITQYEILRVFSNGVSDAHGSAGGRDTSYTLRGLETGREHQFAVKAKLSLGETDKSNTVKITLTSESGKGAASTTDVVARSPPGRPGNVAAEAATHERIDLTWSSPGSGGGSSVTGYRIEFRAGDSERFETAEADTGSAARSYTHTGLDPETRYTYRVNAVSGALVGPPSDEASAVTLDRAAGEAAAAASGSGSGASSSGASGAAAQSAGQGQAGASGADQGAATGPKPAPPRGLAGERTSERQVDLSWSEPGSGGDVESYRIEYRTDGGPYEVLAEPGAAETSYEHGGAEPGSSYEYRVYAVNENGQSRASNTAAVPAAGGAAGAAGDDPLTRVPGFPDPGTSSREYVDRYESDPAFRSWFDETFPGYIITDVVGEPFDGEAAGGTSPADLVFPDPNISLSIYLGLYETDAGFRSWFDETYPGSTVEEVVGRSAAGAAAGGGSGAGAAAGGDPRSRVPGFPDPETSAREYVDRYESDPAFKSWFDETFSGYSITDLVGEPEAPPAPEEPDRLPYYKGRYDGEPAYRAWFDSYFSGRSLAEVVGTVDRPYGECGKGTALRDGICQVDAAAGQ